MNKAKHLGYCPVQLIQYANQQHAENSLRIYLALKYGSDCGIIRTNKQMIFEYCEWLQIHPKTFKSQIKRLEAFQWINIDQNSKMFIRGYKSLENRIGQRFRKRVELHSNYFQKDIYKPFLLGAVVGYYVWLQAAKILAGSKSTGSQQVRKTPRPLSQRYIAKVTNLTFREITSRLRKAEDQGFISKTPQLKEIDAKPRDLPLLIKAHQSGEPFPVIIKGKLFLRDADCFNSHLTFKRYRD